MFRAAVGLAAVVVAVVISRSIGFAAGHCRCGQAPVENGDRCAVAFVVVLGVVVVIGIVLVVVVVVAFAVVVVVVVAVVAVALW